MVTTRTSMDAPTRERMNCEIETSSDVSRPDGASVRTMAKDLLRNEADLRLMMRGRAFVERQSTRFGAAGVEPTGEAVEPPIQSVYQKALEHAESLVVAYDAEEQWLDYAREQGWENAEFYHDPKTGADICVAYDPETDQVKVVIPGTDGPHDKWIDGQIRLMDSDGFFGVSEDTNCRVHCGFRKQAIALEGFLAGAEGQPGYLQRHGYQSSSLSITGHSLGGATGTLLAGSLVAQGYQVDELFTFGAPKVGNEATAELLAELFSGSGTQTVRVTHGNDIVCRTPPAGMGYTHGGFWNDLHLGSVNPDRIEDHYMTNYIAALQRVQR